MKYCRSHPSKLNSLCFAWLLSLALIIGQWSGYSHRLQHLTTVVGATVTLSNVIATHGEVAAFASVNAIAAPSYEALLHSCLLVDAATLGDGVSHVIHQFTPLNFSFPSIDYLATATWQALLRPVFLSRAPPSFFINH